MSESCSVMSNSLRPHGLYSPWNSPGQNTGVGSLSLLQGIFPTQGSNPGLHIAGDSLPAEDKGSKLVSCLITKSVCVLHALAQVGCWPDGPVWCFQARHALNRYGFTVLILLLSLEAASVLQSASRFGCGNRCSARLMGVWIKDVKN